MIEKKMKSIVSLIENDLEQKIEMYRSTIGLVELLLQQVDEYHDAGNTLRWSCRTTIRDYEKLIGLNLELEEEVKIIDDLERLWNEWDKRKIEDRRQKTLETIRTKKENKNE